MRKMTRVKALREFFEQDGGRRLTMEELKDLPKEDREELGNLAAEALGVEIEVPQ
jgi:hypothetical protein